MSSRSVQREKSQPRKVRSFKFEKLESRHLLSADGFEIEFDAEFEREFDFANEDRSEEHRRENRRDRSGSSDDHRRGNSSNRSLLAREVREFFRDYSRHERDGLLSDRSAERQEHDRREHRGDARRGDERWELEDDIFDDDFDIDDDPGDALVLIDRSDVGRPESDRNPEGEFIEPLNDPIDSSPVERTEAPSPQVTNFVVVFSVPPSSSTPSSLSLPSTSPLGQSPSSLTTSAGDSAAQESTLDARQDANPNLPEQDSDRSSVNEDPARRDSAVNPLVSTADNVQFVSVRGQGTTNPSIDSLPTETFSELLEIDWSRGEAEGLDRNPFSSVLPRGRGDDPSGFQHSPLDHWLRRAESVESEIVNLGILLDSMASQRVQQLHGRELTEYDAPGEVPSVAVVSVEEAPEQSGGMILLLPEALAAGQSARFVSQDFDAISDSSVAQWTIGVGFYSALEVVGQSDAASAIVTPDVLKRESNVLSSAGETFGTEPTETSLSPKRAAGVLVCCLGFEYLRSRRKPSRRANS